MVNTWPFDPNLQKWGATFNRGIAPAGREYWKLLSAEGPVDIGGNHHIYVEVLGRDGRRAVGVPVLFYWHGGDHLARTEPKTGEPYAVNMPMSAGGNAYGVRIADGRPSDDLFGMGMGSFVPHHSFALTFQLAIATQDPIIVPEPPNNPMTALECIETAIFYLNMAKERL